MSYVLRLSSDYSILSSTIKIDDIISYCSQASLNRCFLIDNNLHGSLSFIKKCEAKNIKPIVGLDVNVTYNEETYVLTLIAKNNKGLSNLYKISYESYNSSIDLKALNMYSEGLILLINFDNSYIASMLNNNMIFEANNYLEILQSMFKDIYFGVYRHLAINKENLSNFIDYAKHNSIKVVASQIANHINNKDTIILNLLDSIKNKKAVNKDFLTNSFYLESYLKSYEELKLTYEKDELISLDELANKCNIHYEKANYSLPSVSDIDSKEALTKLAFDKLNELKLNENQLYVDRLNKELNVINSKGFSNYYLIVADYVNYAKSHDILTSLRGSGVSSLVAYLLNISSIDPLKHDLLFERFLNEKRSNYPDFDMDFEDISKDKIVEYIKEKYGKDNVSFISTFNTFGSKGAIIEVCKALNKSNEISSEITKMMSKNVISINDEYKNNLKFKSLLDIHSDYKSIVSLASGIERLNRQVGVHPAGIIISKEHLKDITPCFINSDGNLISQYEAIDIESSGLIKMDLLSLKNLTILNYCFKELENRFGLKYNTDNYPYDDKKAYELISRNDTIGLFQIDTVGMKDVISKIKPSCFDDVCSLIALFRPGSMAFIDEYISRKNGKEFAYFDESLIDVLKPTYGIIVYQEQIMQIVSIVANFDLAKADIFRKAISKKNFNVLNEQRDDFVSGAINNGFSKEKANKLFEVILRFAEYGFNKAHSVSYAKFALIMASLKANYPEIFYEALLNVNKEKDASLRNIFNEAKHYDIKINKPDANTSSLYFSSKKSEITFGLSSILDVNESIANIIINERKIQPFNDVYDFVIRIIKKDVSIHVLENLIYSGALDSFNIDRSNLIGSLTNLYEFAMMFYKYDYIPNTYDNYKDIMVPLLFFTNDEIDYNKKEYEMLGMYLTTHPIRKIKDSLNDKITNIDEIINDGYYNIVCKIISVEKKKQKDDKEYTLYKLEDETKLVTIRDYKNIKTNALKNNIIKANVTYKNNYFYLNSLEVLL